MAKTLLGESANEKVVEALVALDFGLVWEPSRSFPLLAVLWNAGFLLPWAPCAVVWLFICRKRLNKDLATL